MREETLWMPNRNGHAQMSRRGYRTLRSGSRGLIEWTGQPADLESAQSKIGTVLVGFSTIFSGGLDYRRKHCVGSHWVGIPWGRAPLPGGQELRQGSSITEDIISHRKVTKAMLKNTLACVIQVCCVLTVTSHQDQQALNSSLQIQHTSDALKIGPPGPFWHLASPQRATPKGSGGGSRFGCATFTMKQPRI
eukprot:1969480-Pleurochrysis_carterae.AAC.7